ncbi:MAG: hypothetical protein V7K21_27430 [Nostoc sp.]|uniref:hypothetical protein n=1 Tax=Nostoc sp. TaxID=1180 RepID=UPI002FF663B9
MGNAEEIFIPSVAIGKLFYGAGKSGRSLLQAFRIKVIRLKLGNENDHAANSN